MNIAIRPSRHPLVQALLCLALLLAAHGAYASDGTLQIVRFFDAAATIEVAMRTGLEQVKARDPVLGDFTERALAEFDIDEAARRLALLFDKFLDAGDVREFSAFIESPAGVKVARIFKVQKSQAGLREAFSALPRPDFIAADRFFSTRPAQRAINAIYSPEFKQWASQYGEELVCNYVGRTMPDALEKARKAGKCMAGK